MSHYFVTPDGPAHRREVRATIWGRDYVFTTADGVFSGDRLDPGTAVLLRACPPPDLPDGARLLDLGCGFGPIAVALASQCPTARVDAVDVNARAVELTRLNATAAGVGDRVRACHPDELLGHGDGSGIPGHGDGSGVPGSTAGVAATPAGGTASASAPHYDQIWSNPPIRIGKAALHDLLATWFARLTPGGAAFLVVGKNLGADSLQSWLDGRGWSTERLASAKGYRVLRVRQAPCYAPAG